MKRGSATEGNTKTRVAKNYSELFFCFFLLYSATVFYLQVDVVQQLNQVNPYTTQAWSNLMHYQSSAQICAFLKYISFHTILQLMV